MQTRAPFSIDYDTTTYGARRAVAHFPLSVAHKARHLPAFEHKGTTYVPYTGTVVTADRMVKYQRAVGYYMEYRALRETNT